MSKEKADNVLQEAVGQVQVQMLVRSNQGREAVPCKISVAGLLPDQDTRCFRYVCYEISGCSTTTMAIR